LHKSKSAIIRHLGKPIVVRRFNPSRRRSESIRAYLLGLRIKLLVRCGFGVVVVGRCGYGKSHLLEKTLPNRVITPDRSLLQTGKKERLDLSKVPHGMFAVDDAMAFDWSNSLEDFPALRGRKVVFTMQSIDGIVKTGLDVLFGERLLIVYIGTLEAFRQECRQSLSRPLREQMGVFPLG
jgi:hypothetical protein